ncbi:hypothetical protein niasHT_009723 [Heterodera trifolii]|uniref:Uncharacterized protein n=1 Tax=Heterodera trifolii TaxID=157864 RepID=A0ABD2MFJ0_9BILA
MPSLSMIMEIIILALHLAIIFCAILGIYVDMGIEDNVFIISSAVLCVVICQLKAYFYKKKGVKSSGGDILMLLLHLVVIFVAILGIYFDMQTEDNAIIVGGAVLSLVICQLQNYSAAKKKEKRNAGKISIFVIFGR